LGKFACKPGNDAFALAGTWRGFARSSLMTDSQQRVWDIIAKTGVGMLTTRFAGGLRARPLEARPDRDAGLIYFLTDVRGLKDDEIRAAPQICFTMINAAEKAYLSITGRADILRDSARAEKIWTKPDTVWWPDGPQDENVRVIRLEPQTAELWDGPSSSLVAAYEFAKARVTGEKPDLGENRKMSVPLR
jgi:general stress protein 26